MKLKEKVALVTGGSRGQPRRSWCLWTPTGQGVSSDGRRGNSTLVVFLDPDFSGLLSRTRWDSWAFSTVQGGPIEFTRRTRGSGVRVTEGSPGARRQERGPATLLGAHTNVQSTTLPPPIHQSPPPSGLFYVIEPTFGDWVSGSIRHISMSGIKAWGVQPSSSAKLGPSTPPRAGPGPVGRTGSSVTPSRCRAVF